MRIFCTMDAVQFDPVGPEDEQLAKEETGYTRHVLWKKNPGFMILYEWLKTMLLQKVGYTKYWWEDSEKVSFKRYSGLTDEQLTLLMQDLEQNGEVEVLEQEQDEGAWSVKLKFTTEYGCARVDGAPPEEVIVSADCKGDIKRAKFVGHLRTDLTRSDLIEMGYDKKQVKALTDFTWEQSLGEKIARDSVQESTRDSDADSDWPSETIRLLEATPTSTRTMTASQSFAACSWRATTRWRTRRPRRSSGAPPRRSRSRSGTSACPCTTSWKTCSASTPRSSAGCSITSTSRTRRARSTTRIPSTCRRLQINRPGGHVANDGPVMGAVAPLAHQPIVGDVLPVIDYFDRVRDKRTGSTAMQTGSDADVLASTTKGAYMDARSAANQRIEAIARIFAETGLLTSTRACTGC
jgi:hypothetical protein